MAFWKLERYRIFILLIFVNIMAYMIRFALSIAILGVLKQLYNLYTTFKYLRHG